MGLYDKKGPYVYCEQPGVIEYCRCGMTEEIPYCDGSHAGKHTGKRPYIVKLEEPRMVSICGCGRSNDLPYCDGSHQQAQTTTHQD